MGELGLNKIFGALLAAVLVILGLRELSGMVFTTGGGYHHGEDKPLNEWAQKFAYRIDIPEPGTPGEAPVEEVYDLGLLLASADASRGERVYKAQCASCHTIEQGGGNLTGPNLYDKLGGAKQGKADFANYSGALNNTEGDWSWENMDAWLANPSAYARGTSMAYAGLRRDDQRAAVLLYLAENSTIAPTRPEPLPTVEAAAVETLEDGMENVSAEGVEAEMQTTVEGEEATESAADIVDAEITEAVDAAVEDATTSVSDVVEAAGDAVEEIVEEATAE